MLKKRIKSGLHEFWVLLKSVPSIIVVLFIMSVFSMNLLANKSISVPVDWLALDCGIIVSWFAFFTMDVLTKHFGPKAATEMTVLAILVNLFFCFLLFIGSVIPGMWGEAYVEGSEDLLNGALNRTFGGTWYVVFGSTAAFLVSAIVNNLSNYSIGKLFKRNPDGLAAYVLRAYVSTAVGQFTDNLSFALIVSHFFFGWTILQCVTCAVTGMLVELLCEAIFFYPGFAITRRWKRESVGEEYFRLKKGN
ncbi:MAG: VUT family protein [Christensenellaceae bacterium]|nr:VUT family protein [Christensenellaceae bacterium]